MTDYSTTNIWILADTKEMAQKLFDDECDRVGVPRRKAEFSKYTKFKNVDRKTKEWIGRP